MLLPEEFMDYPDYVDNMALAATTEEKYTVPKGYSFAVITGDVTFYIAPNGATAAIPSTEVATGLGSLPWAPGHPLKLKIDGLSANGGKISFIASATCKVGIALYK